MRKALPPLNWFRAFEASARRLSFTAAADEIGMTQSAVSQQIRALETRFGVTLFARSPRGINLTDEGRKLLPQVEVALQALGAATERFDGVPQKTDLLIAASISVTEWLISPALPDFVAANPGISLRFQTAIWPDEFVASEADVEIRFGSERQVGNGAELLMPMVLRPFKSSSLPGGIGEVALIEAVGTSRGWSAWGERSGQSDVSPTLFTDSYGLALQLARSCNGVALVIDALARRACDVGQLVPASDTTIDGNEGYFLAVNRSTPATDAFTVWLRSLVASSG
ncbi:MAG: LysR family transcriptional regulator [Marinovum sp.]|nr:LysR family transcriptional regulator [Marinovum sp.]